MKGNKGTMSIEQAFNPQCSSFLHQSMAVTGLKNLKKNPSTEKRGLENVLKQNYVEFE